MFHVRRGRVMGRNGFVLDKAEDLDARRAGRPRPRAPLRRGPAARASRSWCSCRASRPSSRLHEEWLSPLRGSYVEIRVPAAGRQARAAGDRRAQRQGGVHPPPAPPAGRPQQPGEGPQRAAGPPRPARGAAADRVLRHEPHPGHRLRRLDGRARGRAAEEVRVPPLQGRRASPATTTSPPWRRCSPAGSPPTSPSAASRRRAAGQVRLPAAAAARRRRQGPARRGRPGARRARPDRRDPGRLAGQAVRGGVRARRGPSPIRIPRQSEALYLLQRIRDEAHRFAITYHRELRGKRMTTSVLDGIPGLGETRKKRLVKELGGVRRRQGGVARGLQALRGCPTRWPTRCTRSSTATTTGGR